MAFNQSNQTQKLEEDTALMIPLSPASQTFSSPIISFNTFCVVELETLLDEFETTEIIRNLFLPLNARFSSIIHFNEKGVPCWKKVDVRVEDHIIVPTFPKGLSTIEYYNECLQEYLAKIAAEPLSSNRPLWEVHVVKYPTLYGKGSVVFKFSHALGDGYSMVSVLFTVFKRADDPSRPLTLPDMSLSPYGGKKSLWTYVSKCINTISDIASSALKGSILEDSKSAIRSGKLGVEFEPIAISSINISMDRVKQVKLKLGGTINDVITGVIYYTIHLYMVKKGDISAEKSMNLVMAFNTRMLQGYKSIEEMLRANVWGNHVALLLVPIPCISGEQKVDPLYFVTKAKEIMDKKKNSMFTYLSDSMNKLLRATKGIKGVTEFLYANLRNSSTTVTSLIGPKEKMALAGHPVGSINFFMSGVPQSLVLSAMSLTGQLRLTATVEKNFIDSKVFNSCMKEAFENIFDAACGAGTTS
ncbi:O-acyltransferase wsd1 [Thalictrum thalictroides]|uniref:O-acyltransferase wsd1 n=1 Tax=Thalictrum thalictroides TaxID=46969 RepID=A0A7J6WPB4_THATH|nr:O-acyltransferase wsd1 [Thalictrum thalictroides]